MSITIKTAADIEAMRTACRLASEVLDILGPHVRAGVTTNELDRIAHDHIVNVQKAIPAPLNYQPPGYTPYPKSICTSVNQVICHGIPNDKPLKNGDIVNLDITVIKDGWHGDTSRMFVVGEGSIAAKRLCALTYDAMWKGILKVRPGARLGDIGNAIQTFVENQGLSVVREFCGHGIGRKFHEEPQILHYGRPGTLDELKPGVHLGDIGHAIQRFAESNGFSVVREFCGHGIGRIFHEEPQVLHYGKPGTLEMLKPGMTFTIEPMINAGKKDIKEGPEKDGWTIVTKDRSLSAQWEHTVVVTETGYEVLTLSDGSPPLPDFVTTTRC